MASFLNNIIICKFYNAAIVLSLLITLTSAPAVIRIIWIHLLERKVLICFWKHGFMLYLKILETFNKSEITQAIKKIIII